MQKVMAWAGEIDYGQRQGLTLRTSEVLSLEGLSGLIVDLSAVTFIDAGGIGALLDARNRALDTDVGFVLRGIPGPVRRLLDLTNLSRLFDTE